MSHAISTRRDGQSVEPYTSLNMGFGPADAEDRVAANRSAFTEAMGVPADEMTTAWLTHGTDVAVFRADRRTDWRLDVRPVRSGSVRVDRIFDADAVISDVPGLHFMLTFADCVPLVFVDRRQGVVGAAHAGWRGTAAGIGPAVIRAMHMHFGSHPEDIQAGIGPSIGSCCYTVGPDVLRAFTASGNTPVVSHRGGQTRLDLWRSNETQLCRSGVSPASIETAGICTSCYVDMYYSHRAEAGLTGRFAMCVGLR